MTETLLGLGIVSTTSTSELLSVLTRVRSELESTSSLQD